MKSILYIIIFSSSTLLLSSCEKSESDHARHERLGIRAENCDYCPEDDCCCYVELANGASSANLVFCGTTNPDISTSVCGPIVLEDPCPAINGFYWTEDLFGTGGTSNEFFCVEKGTSFMIGVGPSSGSSVRFTCQYGQLNPQFITLNLSAGEKRYYTINEACVLSECHLE